MLDHLGEVVLIYFENKPAVYARIEAIEPDIKKGWFHITFLFLTLPAQVVTWILRDSYIEGEPFTMGGKAVRLEEVKRADVPKEEGKEDLDTERNKSGNSAKIIPLKKI